MRRLLTPSLIGLALPLALAGCGNETEETPDITEAIPLDRAAGEQADGEERDADEASSQAGSENGIGGDSTPPIPGAEDATRGGGARPRSIPDTMEAGVNPPGMTEPPKGSKVQRFN